MTARPRKRKAPKRAPPPGRRRRVEARRDPLDDFILSAGRALDLKIEKSWMPAVRAHLKVTLAHGARAASFALPDDAELAPVFEA
jgi:hypothetical protein